jgi:hypothetical protein
MTVAQILSRLPGAKKTATGWQAKCPAHDDKSPSLSIKEGSDGRTLLHCHAGCTPEDICGKLGLKLADLFNGKPSRNGGKAFNWQQCVDAFTKDDARKLSKWRGLSKEFVSWLQAGRSVGQFDGKIAFPVHNQGAIVSCHYRATEDFWLYEPKGKGTHPLIFGDVRRASFVLAFESQWDAFARASS